jgi:hypothetical protein
MRAIVHTVSTPPKGATYDALDLQIEINIPFVPTSGTGLKVTPSGDILTCDQVMWDINEPDLIRIFMKEPDDLPSLAWMLEEGWKSDLPNPIL